MVGAKQVRTFHEACDACRFNSLLNARHIPLADRGPCLIHHTPPTLELTDHFKGLSAQVIHGGLSTSERTIWRSQETGLIHLAKVCSSAARRTIKNGDMVVLDSARVKGLEPGANIHSTKSDGNGTARSAHDAGMRVCALQRAEIQLLDSAST